MSNSKKPANSQPWEDFDAHLTEATVSVVPPEEEAAIEDALAKGTRIILEDAHADPR